jgi:hypothetical protein
MATTVSSEIDDIRRKMAQLRINLHHDMRGVVAGAEAATDWSAYVRQYPWSCVGLAVVAGLLVVPRRRRSIRATAKAAASATAEQIQEAAGQIDSRSSRGSRRSGLLGFIVPLIGPIALKAAQAYAAQYIEYLLARQSAIGPGTAPNTSRTQG